MAKKKDTEKQSEKQNKDHLFKPGQSGNPNGRPKKDKAFTDIAKALLESQELDITWTVNGEEKSIKVTADKNLNYGLAASLITEGLKGDSKAIKEILDRTEGKAIQKVMSQNQNFNSDVDNMTDDDLDRELKKFEGVFNEGDK